MAQDGGQSDGGLDREALVEELCSDDGNGRLADEVEQADGNADPPPDVLAEVGCSDVAGAGRSDIDPLSQRATR